TLYKLCFQNSRPHVALEEFFELISAVRIGVLVQNTTIASLADFVGAFGTEATELFDNFMAILRDEHFLPGFEEQLDSGPGIGQQTRGRARGFKYTGRGRETVARHAAAIDVEHGDRRGIKRIMLAGINMDEPPD